MAEKPAAFKSGMRGAEEVSPAFKESPGEEQDQETERSMEEIVADHIHGPDEAGHHHLNLTTLAEEIHKSGGLHKE